MRGFLAAFASARQLLWLLVLVAVTGVPLLVPLVSSLEIPGPADRLLRSVHAAASLLLVVGSLLHAVLRLREAPVTRHALVSGFVASATFGVGAVTGAAAARADVWSSWLGAPQDSVRNAASILHFGYVGALALAAAYWHVRGRTAGLLPRIDPGATLALLAAFGMGAAGAWNQGTGPNVWTTMLAPPVAVLAAWTLLAPNVVWIYVPWRRAAPGPAR